PLPLDGGGARAGPLARRGPDLQGAPLKLLAAAVAAGTLAFASSSSAPRIAGCQVFPASNPWNQRVDRLPVAKSSTTIVDSIGADTGLHPDFGSGLWDGGPIGIPITTVRAGVPKS